MNSDGIKMDRMVRRHTKLGFAQSEKAQLAMDFNS